MNPKIKLRRSNSISGKKVDKGEPFFNYDTGKLYIGTADNQDVSSAAEIAGGGSGTIPDNITCNTIVTSRENNSGSTIELKNDSNVVTVSISGDDGNSKGAITIGGTLSADSVSANSIVTPARVAADSIYTNHVYSNPTSGTIAVHDDIIVDSDEALKTNKIMPTTNGQQIDLAPVIINKADATTDGLTVQYGDYGTTHIKAGSISTGTTGSISTGTISASSLSTSSTITSSGKINANGGIDVPSGKTLTVNGTTTLNGTTNFNGTLSVNSLTASSVTASNGLSVGSNGAIINGATSINGNTTVTGQVNATGGFFSNGLIAPLFSTTVPTDFNEAKTGPRFYFDYKATAPANAPASASFPKNVMLEVFSNGYNVIQRCTLMSAPTQSATQLPAYVYVRTCVNFPSVGWIFSDWAQI